MIETRFRGETDLAMRPLPKYILKPSTIDTFKHHYELINDFDGKTPENQNLR